METKIEFEIEQLHSIDDLSKYRKGHLVYGITLLFNNLNDITELITIRWYSTKTYIKCCMWISDSRNNIWICGAGKAGGYGYHKGSVAYSDALSSMGIDNKDVSGVGNTAIEESLFMMAEKLGYNREFLHLVKFYA